MKYEWEAKISKISLSRACAAATYEVPGTLRVCGLMVCNDDTGEAAFLTRDVEDGVIKADYLKDALGDALEAYNDAVDGLFPRLDDEARAQG